MVFTRPKLNPEQRYSVKETCIHMGMCRDTLLKYTNQGQLNRYVHFTGTYFYLGKELLAFWDKLDATGTLVAKRGRKPKKK